MKIILAVFILNICISPLSGQKNRDTLLFINKNNHQIIFIDSANSNFHRMVIDNFFSECRENNLSFFSQTDKEKESYKGLWISVFKYGEKFYAYSPSESYYNNFIFISDSALILNEFNEGLVTYKVRYKNVKMLKVSFQLLSHEGVKHTLLIRKRNRSLYTIKSSLFRNRKMFFVRVADYYDYPIIVNFCPDNRCKEFEFK